MGDYEWMTYAQAGAKVEAVGSALVGAGVAPGDRVGVYGANSPEWMIAMQVRWVEVEGEWRGVATRRRATWGHRPFFFGQKNDRAARPRARALSAARAGSTARGQGRQQRKGDGAAG